MFDWLARLAKRGDRFDLVILDPPGFSRTKSRAVFSAATDYGELAGLAARVTAPGGSILACCNVAELPWKSFRDRVLAGWPRQDALPQSHGVYHEPALDFPAPARPGALSQDAAPPDGLSRYQSHFQTVPEICIAERGQIVMPTETYQTLYRLIETLPVVSSHEHHRPDDFQSQLTLDRMIEKSYVGWRGCCPAPTELAGRFPGPVPAQQLLRMAGKGHSKSARLQREDHGGQLG